jgi:hypothetical protein
MASKMAHRWHLRWHQYKTDLDRYKILTTKMATWFIINSSSFRVKLEGKGLQERKDRSQRSD